MKKIYLFALASIMSGVALAQTPLLNASIVKIQKTDLEAKESFKTIEKFTGVSGNREEFGPRWLNFASAYDFLEDQGQLTTCRLFPDSMPRITASNNSDYAYNAFSNSFYSVGQVFDFGSKVFADAYQDSNYTQMSSYSVDSLGIYMIYGRNIDVTDTLRVRILKEGSNFVNLEASNGAPYSYVAYDGTTNMVDGDVVASYDVLLTAADTSTLLKYIPVNVSLEPGEQMAVTFNFHPGFSYTANDNWYTDLNNFRLYSYEEDSASDAMISRSYEDSATFNQGLFADDWNRYGLDTSILGDYYYCGFNNAAYSSADHLWMMARVTGEFEEESNDTTSTEDTTSINELSMLGGLNIYPNPSNGVVNVDFIDANDANNNAIRVYNIIGNLVYRNDNPMIKNQFDVSTLTSGIYTIRVGNVARRLIIE